MRAFFRGTTTVEVMVALVAMSLVFSASYVAKSSLFMSYHNVIHRERALLYAVETLEQLEAFRLTRLQQNYVRSWDTFLGEKEEGYYQLVTGAELNSLSFLPLRGNTLISSDDPQSVRFYDGRSSLSDNSDGFYSRLERRLYLESLPNTPEGKSQRRVTVSVYWGLPGQYRVDGSDQIKLQAQYSDHTAPAFVL